MVEAKLNQDFGGVLSSFDLLLPDGMPIRWVMNARGARLPDRVYGPYLMRYVIQHSPAPYRHFLFGGSPECLRQLQERLLQLQPKLQIVGTISPPFSRWSETDEENFAREISKVDPDFIWVALGGVKQETWIAKNKFRHRRGVFLAVGDAFELLAGRRSFAPVWMQRAGLTWVYRLAQEPRRLWKRYLFCNAAFIFLILTQCFRRSKPPTGPASSHVDMP